MTNPALGDLAPLLGQWTTALYGAAFLPDLDTRATGSVAVDWTSDGAAVVIRQSNSDNLHSATWIVGRDDSSADFVALYADDRGVSRIYQMSFAVPDWHIWRTTPEFSQRFEAVISSDGSTMKGAWTKSFDGGTIWEHDFNLDYIRAPSS
jgi:hypothetical protein